MGYYSFISHIKIFRCERRVDAHGSTLFRYSLSTSSDEEENFLSSYLEARVVQGINILITFRVKTEINYVYLTKLNQLGPMRR